MSEEERRFSIQDGVEAEKEQHMELRVVGQDGSVVQFRIKLSKPTAAPCGRQAREGLPPAAGGSATPAACPCWWSPRCFSARILVGSVSVCRCAGE